MTNYQRLINSITNEIYLFYNTSNNWDEIEAKQTSHKILTLVEEFKHEQEKISEIKFYRSDALKIHKVMTLYVVKINEDMLITHDGEVQLGIYHTTIENFMSMAKENYIETYWMPDVFCHRYKRNNYQKHLKKASIGTKDEI